MPQKPALPAPSVESQVQEARRMLAQEQPSSQGAVVKPAGLFNRVMDWFSPSYMTTDPRSGDISYYPTHLQGRSTQEIGDLLAHELTHRQQVLSGNVIRGGEPYYRQPAELAGYEAQVRRAASQGRSTVTPSFETGQDTYRADIPLFPMKRAAMLGALKR